MGIAAFGAVIGAVGSLVQGVMGAQVANYQAKVANAQLKIDMENDRIRAAQEENDRIEMFQTAEQSNRVASAVMVGGGRNYSFDQGIAPFNKTVMARDVATIGYNRDMEVGRKKYQIAVNKWNAKAQATSSIVGGIFGAADSLSEIRVGQASYRSSGGTPA